ncbi:MAG TPA: D-2-hydroxyacid dehydrogenase [Pseudonocardia sp.]|nr:D-2-hydroxyacid dehydrogenase [Pseudonocardia sp.]
MSEQETVDVVVTLDFDDEWLARVAAVDPRVRVHKVVTPSADEIPADLLARARVMYTSTAFPSAGRAPRLGWVQLDTSGVDHVRGSDLWRSKVPITTIGGVSPRPLAGWVMAQVLAHAYHLREVETLARSGTWPSFAERWDRLMPHPLAGATIGIVGYGRIGREIGRLAEAFGMHVTGMRRGGPAAGERLGEEAPGAEAATVVGPEGLPKLLAESDYVVLTVPYTPQTHHLLDAAAIATMRPTAVLINAARGGVVDEDALLRAVDEGRIAFAALDVFATEPLPADSPLWRHPRVLVSPHVAGFAPDYHERVGGLFRDNLARFLSGAALVNLADRERGY